MSEQNQAQAPGPFYEFGGWRFERNGWRWGVTAHGYGVGGHRTPIGAVIAWWRWKRERDADWERRHGA